MKKFISMFAMAQMIIWSCAKPEIDDTPAPVTPDKDGVVFTALADVAMAKANPAAGGVVSWTENDEIGVYDGTDYVKAEIISIEGNKVVFSAQVDKNADKYIAVSPYEFALTDNGEFTMDGENVKLNTAATAQTAGKQVVSIATTSAPTDPFAFKNVCNLLRFKVEKATVKQAKITGAAGTEKIAGVLSVNPATGAATGSLTETAIVTEITPGVDNFIALAPGTSLPDGFTITLYGDQINDAGYEGEVASVGALDFTGENARNKMRNLGTIDGWIDNYALWQKGKPITIAGKDYSKESTGQSATLISAKDADFDLFDTLYGKSGVFFLEASSDYGFWARTFVNVGTAASNSNMFLISRYDNAPVNYKPTYNFGLISGNMYLKGINLSAPTTGTDYFTVSDKATFGDLHLDNCKIGFTDKRQFYYATGDASFGIKSIKVVNSKIENLHTSNVTFINWTGSFLHRTDVKEIELRNNVFYSDNTTGYIKILQDLYNPSDAGTITTTFSFVNNTLYNTHPTNYGGVDIDTYTIGKQMTITGNIFYNEEPGGTAQLNTSNLVGSRDANKTYLYEIKDNVSNHFAILHFRSYAGWWRPTTDQVTKATDLAFKTADTEKGIFIPIDKYAGYGAKQ